MKISKSLVSVSIVIICIMLYKSVCYPANWTSFGTSDDGLEYFVDIDSIEREGNKSKCLVKTALKNNNYVVTLFLFDISNMTAQILNITSYDSNGKQIGKSYSFSKDISEKKYIMPGTPISILFDSFINNRKK
jgi:hypothetical protein